MPKCVDIEQLLCDKMVDLMKDTPFYKIKVTDLVRYANVSRSTFYLYFDSIYDVVERMEEKFFTGLIDVEDAADYGRPQQNGQKLYHRLILETTRHLRQYRDVFCALSGENGDPGFNAKLMQRTRNWLRALIESEYRISKNSTALVAEYVASGVVSFQRYVMVHEDEYTDEQIANMAFNLLSSTLETLSIS